MAFDLTYINAALTRTGDPVITELNDGTPGSNIAGQNYALLVKTALTAYPWKFATKTQALVNITGDPDPPWLYAYQIPTDTLMLRSITVGGFPVDYEQQTNKLLCDQDTSADVIAKYTWSVPEAYWPGDFAEAITQQLEALFLRGVGERYQEAEARANEAKKTFQIAKTNDAKRKTPSNPFVSATLAARSGLISSSRLPWR
jgi:hypothetical protein